MARRAPALLLLGAAMVTFWVTTKGINVLTVPFFGVACLLGLAAIAAMARDEPEWSGHLALLAGAVALGMVPLTLILYGVGLSGFGWASLKAATAGVLFALGHLEIRRETERHRALWSTGLHQHHARRRARGLTPGKAAEAWRAEQADPWRLPPSD